MMIGGLNTAKGEYMLRFSNEDYSVPRERITRQSGNGRNNIERYGMEKFRCDGSRVGDGREECGMSLPKTCNGEAALASVYSPYQEYRELFDGMSALANGTLFKELYKPFKGGACNG